MKKYILLMIGTALCIGLIFGIKEWQQPKPVEVSVVTLQEQTVRQTVDCTGRVQQGDSTEVFFELPCVAGDVYVTVGQQVEKGDPLFSVDVTATQSVLSQMGSALPDTITDTTHTVTATASGTVTTVNVKQGQLTDPSVPCAVIAPRKQLQIAAVVREKYLQQVKAGQAVEIKGVGFEKPLYHGTLLSLSDTARQQYVGTVNETVVDAVIAFNETEIDNSLRVGLGATVAIVVDTVEKGLLIPYDCVAQDEEGNEYVYVCTDDGTARRRVIEGARDCATGVLAVSGVSAGDRLVRDPEQLKGETAMVLAHE